MNTAKKNVHGGVAYEQPRPGEMSSEVGNDKGSEGMGMTRDGKGWQILEDWDEREGREAGMLGREGIGRDEKEWKGRK